MRPGKKPLPKPLPSGGKNIVLLVELSPVGHALLQTLAVHAECASVPDFIRELLMKECSAFGEALADEKGPELQEYFPSVRKGDA